jgi:hypothetical protein
VVNQQQAEDSVGLRSFHDMPKITRYPLAASITGLLVGAPSSNVALQEGRPTVDAALAFAGVDDLLRIDGPNPP